MDDDIRRSVEVPAEQWTDVHAGQTVVEGCYVDDEGYLRMIENDSYAVWHNRDCQVKHVDKKDIVFAINGAPWCPECYADKEQAADRTRIRNVFKKGIVGDE